MNEEQKAIKRLEEMKNNYSLNSEDLHYANVLYYLIINLQQENQQLKENNLAMQEEMARTWAKHDKLKSTLEEIKTKINSLLDRYFDEKDYCIEDTDLDELLQIIDKSMEVK